MQGLDRTFADYDELWAWSVDEPDEFWRAVWQEFDVPSDGDPTIALADASMPGAVWFPDVRLNYAEAMLRMPGRADDDVVVVAASQSRDDVRLTARELRDQVARARAGPACAPESSPATASPPTRPTSPRPSSCCSPPRASARCSRRAPPSSARRASSTGGSRSSRPCVLAVDGYQYGSQGRRPSRRGRGDHARACRACAPSCGCPTSTPAAPAPDGAITWSELTAEAGAAGVRTPAVRRAALRAVLVGHDGPAQADRARPRRHHDRAPQGPRPPPRPRPGRPVLLVLHDRLDDVEPARLGPGRRVDDRDVRRQPGTPRPADAVAARRAARDHLLRHQRALPAAVPQGGPGARARSPTCRGCVASARPARRCPPRASAGSTTRSARPCSSARSPAAPTCARGSSARRRPCRCTPARSRAACSGCAVEAYDDDRSPVVGSLGELVITEPMPSMPVGFWGDADGSRYRAAYFEDIPGRLAPRRLDHDHRARHVRHHRPQRRDAQPRRRTPRDRRVLHRRRGLARGRRQPGRAPRGRRGRRRAADAVRRARRGTRARRGAPPAHRARPAYAALAAPRPRRRSTRSPRLPRTLSGKKLEVPVKKILQGASIEDAAAKGALANPDSLDAFVGIRESL